MGKNTKGSQEADKAVTVEQTQAEQPVENVVEQPKAEQPPVIVTAAADDGATKEATIETTVETIAENEFEIFGIKARKDVDGGKFIEPYKKAYPNEKTFYATTDKQVFLSANKIEAVEHQKTLDKTGTVTVFEF